MNNSQYSMLPNFDLKPNYALNQQHIVVVVPPNYTTDSDAVVKVRFAKQGQEAISPLSSISCPGAQEVLGAGQDMGTIKLAANGTCDLSVTAPAEANGGDITYTATVSRDASLVYHISAGTISGFPFSSDSTPPTLDIQNAPNAVSDNTPFTVTFEFSEIVTGFELSDIVVGNGTASSFDAVDGNTYTTLITPDGAGPITIDVAAATAQDVAGNDNIQATQTSTSYDTDAPTLDIQNAPASVSDNTPFTVTFEFSEEVTGFELVDIAVGNGSASGFTSVDGNTYTTQITPDGIGDITINVAAGVAEDTAGNLNSAATPVSSSYNATGEITIRKVLQGSSISATFSYSSSDTSFDGLAITVASGTGSSPTISKSTGSYTVTEDTEDKWTLTAISCQGDSDAGSIVNLAGRSVIIDLDANETIICTFTSSLSGGYVKDRTARIIHNFMTRRADLITSNEPDLSGRLFANPTSRPVNGTLALTDGNSIAVNALAFSTSVRQMSRALSATQSGQTSSNIDPDNLMMGLSDQNHEDGFLDRFDIWFKGTWAKSDAGTTGADVGIFHSGLEYRHNPDLLLGLMGQIDRINEKNKSESFEIKGTGWLAGPYAVARIHQNLIFDGRVAWGQASNKINPLGTHTDQFDTQRWLAHAQLSGDFKLGNWRFSPQVKAIYFEESHEGYTDSLDNDIDQQSISLGRMIFGPEIGYSFDTEDDLTIYSRLNIKGIWDFDGASLVDLETGDKATDAKDFKARIETGFGLKSQNGWSLEGDAFYDGIGVAEFETYGGSISLNIHLN